MSCQIQEAPSVPSIIWEFGTPTDAVEELLIDRSPVKAVLDFRVMSPDHKHILAEFTHVVPA